MSKAQSNRKALLSKAQPNRLGIPCVLEGAAEQSMLFTVFSKARPSKSMVFTVFSKAQPRKVWFFSCSGVHPAPADPSGIPST